MQMKKIRRKFSGSLNNQNLHKQMAKQYKAMKNLGETNIH